MGRPLRIQFRNGIFHLTTKTNIRRVAYRQDGDRRLFLALFETVMKRYGWECHSWCLMTTHYHFLVRTREDTLAAGMQLLNGCYARVFNKRHGERSHVFADRYSSTVVESEPHFTACLRYIALNPVEAGMCKSPADWTWSSYAQWVSTGRRPSLLAEPLIDELRGPNAVRWLEGQIEPYAGMAALVRSSTLNGVRHR